MTPFSPDPNPDLYEIAVSRKGDEIPDLLFDIDPATWIITAYGAEVCTAPKAENWLYSQ